MLPPLISTPLQTLKREVPEISEVTENPEVPLVRTMIVYVLIISLFVIVSRPYCSIVYCLNHLLSRLTQQGVPVYLYYCLIPYCSDSYCSIFLLYSPTILPSIGMVYIVVLSLCMTL